MRLLTLCLTLAIAAGAQVDDDHPGKISDPITEENLAGSLTRLSQGKCFMVDIDRVAKAEAGGVVPKFRQGNNRIQTPWVKPPYLNLMKTRPRRSAL